MSKKCGGVAAGAFPRIGFIGNTSFVFTPALITPGSATVTGSTSFVLSGYLTPKLDNAQWNAVGTLLVENYGTLSVSFMGRAASIQNVRDEAEVAWFLDNIGSGTECCDGGTALNEYTEGLSGLMVEIPRTTHGISGSPNVTVLDPTGAEVSVCLEYIGNSVFITSNVPLDNHTAILR